MAQPLKQLGGGIANVFAGLFKLLGLSSSGTLPKHGDGLEIQPDFSAKAGSPERSVVDFVVGGGSEEFVEVVLQATVDEAAVEAMRTDLIPELQQRLLDTSHVFTGDLRESLDVWLDSPGRIVAGSREFGERLSRIEYGTEPREVDDEELDRLVFWVEDKFGVTGKQAEASALGVAVKLETEGNTAYHELADVVEQNRAAIIAEVSRRVGQSLSSNTSISVPRET